MLHLNVFKENPLPFLSLVCIFYPEKIPSKYWYDISTENGHQLHITAGVKEVEK